MLVSNQSITNKDPLLFHLLFLFQILFCIFLWPNQSFPVLPNHHALLPCSGTKPKCRNWIGCCWNQMLLFRSLARGASSFFTSSVFFGLFSSTIHSFVKLQNQVVSWCFGPNRPLNRESKKIDFSSLKA